MLIDPGSARLARQGGIRVLFTTHAELAAVRFRHGQILELSDGATFAGDRCIHRVFPQGTIETDDACPRTVLVLVCANTAPHAALRG